MNALIQKYNIYIYEKCTDLVKSGKLIANWDNYDISKNLRILFCYQTHGNI